MVDVQMLKQGVSEKNKNTYSTSWHSLAWKPVQSGDWKDTLRMTTIVGDHRITTDSHLFGQFGRPDVWVPYADQGLLTDPTDQGVFVSDGNGKVKQVPGVAGDSELAKVLCPNGPGEIGISLKHEKGKDLELDIASAAQSEKQNKEMLKLYDHHIQMYVCMADAAGRTRVITLNNPTNYAKDSQSTDGSGFTQKGVYGGFGTRAYGNIFLRFKYDQLIDPSLGQAFNDNIRTWAVIFNSISWFPSDYDGNDPLMSYSPKTVREHAAMAVHAVINTPGARAWWQGDVKHYLYCAEFAYLAAAAGLAVPLNEQSVVGLKAPGFAAISQADWNKFKRELLSGATTNYIYQANRTNSGQGSGMNNPLRRGVLTRIPLVEAPAGLQPFENLVSDQSRQAAGCDLSEDAAACLAINPLTVADMVRYFLATFIPRYPVYQQPDPQQRAMAEMQVGQVQAQVLFGMREGLYQAVVDERMPEQARQQVRAGIYGIIAGVTGCVDANDDGQADGMCGDSVLTRTHASYEAFVQAVSQDPFFHQAQALVTQGETPYFTPPSLFHVRANGWHHGLLDLEYVAHGLHYSLVKPTGDAGPPSTPSTPGIAPPTLTLEPNYIGYGCRDRSAQGGQDYSMHQCVSLPASWSPAATTDPSGKCQLVTGYCEGPTSVRCCIQ